MQERTYIAVCHEKNNRYKHIPFVSLYRANSKRNIEDAYKEIRKNYDADNIRVITAIKMEEGDKIDG